MDFGADFVADFGVDFPADFWFIKQATLKLLKTKEVCISGVRRVYILAGGSSFSNLYKYLIEKSKVVIQTCPGLFWLH